MPKDLTARQKAVMDLVCKGKTMVEASMILGISVYAVKGRWEKCRERLDAHKDTLAVAKYLRPDLFAK